MNGAEENEKALGVLVLKECFPPQLPASGEVKQAYYTAVVLLKKKPQQESPFSYGVYLL